MFLKSGELYDCIYGAFKDYRKEATEIAAIIRRTNPAAKSILDVACGTGEHARFFSRQHGYCVDGIDLDPVLIEIARAKNLDGRFSAADMTSFELGKTYDAILCLFSAIGYVKSLAHVEQTFVHFRKHLAPGGVVIVEPWFTTETWSPGRTHLKTYEDEKIKIARMSESRRERRLSLLTFHYLIATTKGVQYEIEQHELGLFTVEEMLACFTRAGLNARYDPRGLTDRGLYVAT
jgi:trans-aconitate methyltransferase